MTRKSYISFIFLLIFIFWTEDEIRDLRNELYAEQWKNHFTLETITE